MTVGEVYNPLIKFALENNVKDGNTALKKVGKLLFDNNKDKCNSISEGIEQAKINLDYYCQYYNVAIANKVKKFYGLGVGFRTLFGGKVVTSDFC